jgi:hypothetical protein
MEFNHLVIAMRLRLGRAWGPIYVPCVFVVLVAPEGILTLQNFLNRKCSTGTNLWLLLSATM